MFQRLCLNIDSKSDMKKYLKFEIAPFPLSLFTENGFRKNVKSQLFDHFRRTEALPSTTNVVYIIDGGFLLHKVVWQKNDTIEAIIGKYLSFERSHYTNNSYIIFDGYPNYDINNETPLSTKIVERLRRKSCLSTPFFSLDYTQK